ncbi:hypothetical protein FTUN_2314 [Frigoriglobus tundricola]|uniref:Uncharacterized protein n=1 Tax=Frigoriglobus tundricola TaxID=2774151 RepID=A0A6M5YNG8_9BACT|nr:hypothetical protein FTUN_2314 [Frigoriglobus tundricola]
MTTFLVVGRFLAVVAAVRGLQLRLRPTGPEFYRARNPS